MAITTSLADIVVLFSVLENPPDTVIHSLSDNSRFRFMPPQGNCDSVGASERWKGGQEENLSVVFAFKFQEDIHSPRGWVAGSAPTDDCDFKLAKNNQSGISRFHFCIDISPKNRPRIKNLCRNEIRIKGSEPEDVAILEQEDEWEIEGVVVLDLGAASLRMWRPILTREEAKVYKFNADAFHRDYMSALPRPTHGGAESTLNLRFGHNNALYRKCSDEQPRNGAFGSVIKVKELRQGKIYAAKIPHFLASGSAVADRDQWEMISKEFSKLFKLQHEHIVKSIEILPGKPGIEPPWLVMEWVERNLNTYPLSRSEIPNLLRQVSAGLAYMHRKGFTHRDLKPENILIQGDGPVAVAKIADVGLAKYAGDNNMHTYAGTLLYMAPELWNTEQGYTNAVDLWSLGVLTLELLTNWSIRENGPRACAPPSETRYLEWIHTCVLPQRDEWPQYETILHGLLSPEAEARWTAPQCEQWLLQYSEDSQLENSNSERDSFIRSPHPTLSTGRARCLPGSGT